MYLHMLARSPSTSYLLLHRYVVLGLPGNCGVRFPRIIVGLTSIERVPQIYFAGQHGIHQDIADPSGC